jgi:hypothetical protein
MHIASQTSQLIVAESIQHYESFPTTASSGKSPKHLQPLAPSAGVHLAAVSNGSVPG